MMSISYVGDHAEADVNIGIEASTEAQQELQIYPEGAAYVSTAPSMVDALSSESGHGMVAGVDSAR